MSLSRLTIWAELTICFSNVTFARVPRRLQNTCTLTHPKSRRLLTPGPSGRPHEHPPFTTRLAFGPGASVADLRLEVLHSRYLSTAAVVVFHVERCDGTTKRRSCAIQATSCDSQHFVWRNPCPVHIPHPNGGLQSGQRLILRFSPETGRLGSTQESGSVRAFVCWCCT